MLYDSTWSTYQALTGERRREARTEVRHLALVGDRRVPCMTTNLSAGGAQLLFETAPMLPETFVVRIPEIEVEKTGRMIWRRGTAIGIAFDEPAPPELRSASSD